MHKVPPFCMPRTHILQMLTGLLCLGPSSLLGLLMLLVEVLPLSPEELHAISKLWCWLETLSWKLVWKNGDHNSFFQPHNGKWYSHYPRQSSVYSLVWRRKMEGQVPTYHLPGHLQYIPTDAQCPQAPVKSCWSHATLEELAFISLERDITVVWTRQQSLRRSLSVFQLFLREYFNLQSFLFFYSCCVKKFAPRGNSSFPHQFWSVLKLSLSASNLWTEHCHIDIKYKIKVKNECVFSPWLLHLFFICLDNFFQLLQLHKERIHIWNNLTMFYLYF